MNKFDKVLIECYEQIDLKYRLCSIMMSEQNLKLADVLDVVEILMDTEMLLESKYAISDEVLLNEMFDDFKKSVISYLEKFYKSKGEFDKTSTKWISDNWNRIISATTFDAKQKLQAEYKAALPLFNKTPELYDEMNKIIEVISSIKLANMTPEQKAFAKNIRKISKEGEAGNYSVKGKTID